MSCRVHVCLTLLLWPENDGCPAPPIALQTHSPLLSNTLVL
jgi:hypothetical protein